MSSYSQVIAAAERSGTERRCIRPRLRAAVRRALFRCSLETADSIHSGSREGRGGREITSLQSFRRSTRESCLSRWRSPSNVPSNRSSSSLCCSIRLLLQSAVLLLVSSWFESTVERVERSLGLGASHCVRDVVGATIENLYEHGRRAAPPLSITMPEGTVQCSALFFYLLLHSLSLSLSLSL